MPKNGSRKPNAFDLDKFAKRLDETGKDEAKLTTIEALDVLEDAFSKNKKCFPFYNVYANLHGHLSFDEFLVFHCMLNIRGMEKNEGRIETCDTKWLKKSNSKAAKELARAVAKHPTLKQGWFKLSEQRLMRVLKISRKRQTRIIECLREKGLVLSFVCGMPRRRWVRLNMKKFLKLARTPNCTRAGTTPL